MNNELIDKEFMDKDILRILFTNEANSHIYEHI